MFPYPYPLRTGMAYASLANTELMVGIYTAVFPVAVYVFLGPSRHVSIGTNPLTSILVGNAVDKYGNGTEAAASPLSLFFSGVIWAWLEDYGKHCIITYVLSSACLDLQRAGRGYNWRWCGWRRLESVGGGRDRPLSPHRDLAGPLRNPHPRQDELDPIRRAGERLHLRGGLPRHHLTAKVHLRSAARWTRGSTQNIQGTFAKVY